jgi:hypothetical protein
MIRPFTLVAGLEMGVSITQHIEYDTHTPLPTLHIQERGSYFLREKRARYVTTDDNLTNAIAITCRRGGRLCLSLESSVRRGLGGLKLRAAHQTFFISDQVKQVATACIFVLLHGITYSFTQCTITKTDLSLQYESIILHGFGADSAADLRLGVGHDACMYPKESSIVVHNYG